MNLAKRNRGAPAAPDLSPATSAADEPASLAQRLRLARESLFNARTNVEASLLQLEKERPLFSQFRRALEEAEKVVPQLENALKAACRLARRTLEFPSQDVRVTFADPCSDFVDPRELLAEAPNLMRICPQVLILTQKVDVEALKVAVAAERIPASCLQLIQKVPVTGSGSVSLKYISEEKAKKA